MSALKGLESLATPFTDVTVPEVSAKLHKLGYQMRGNEMMYNGMTGKMLRAPIFLG